MQGPNPIRLLLAAPSETVAVELRRRLGEADIEAHVESDGSAAGPWDVVLVEAATDGSLRPGRELPADVPVVAVIPSGDAWSEAAAVRAGAAETLDLARADAEDLRRVLRRAVVRRSGTEPENRAAPWGGADREARQQFLAALTHELRSPMTGIVGMTSLLMETPLTDRQRDYVATVSSCSDALLCLINDFLDFSKIEAGRLDIERIPFDLRHTLEETRRMFTAQLQAKGLEFVCLTHSNVPVRLEGDPGRLRQILVNLISNAVKFTDAGEITVEVALAEETPEDFALRFTVTDTGEGIPADRVGRLFDPYVQADKSTARRFGGTGLGLSICKRLAELMGGSIGLQSDQGKGSRFWFTVRFGWAEENERERTSRAALDHRPLRVLLADDRPAARAALEQDLNTAGLVVRTVTGASEIAPILQRGRIDVVVLGINGGGFDAVAAAREIRRIAGEVVGLIRLVEFGRKGDAQRMQQAGYDAYLTLPLSSGAILECIHRITTREGSREEQGLITRHTLAEAKREQRPAVLLADDNPLAQRVIGRLLERMGYAFDVVSDGQEALDALSRTRYAAVFLDCLMPVMDGFETVSIMRDRERGTGLHTPVIGMSSASDAPFKKRCVDAGMDEYLVKPLTEEDVQSVLEGFGLTAETSPPARRAA